MRWTELALVLTPLAGGLVLGRLTKPDRAWYDSLDKPCWTPPKKAYGIVWAVLYATMGYAALRVWRAGGRGIAMTLFWLQLFFNFMWSILFSGMRDVRAAAVDSVALWISIVAMTGAYAKHDAVATLLTLPYLAWVTVATALTLTIAHRNPYA